MPLHTSHSSGPQTCCQDPEGHTGGVDIGESGVGQAGGCPRCGGLAYLVGGHGLAGEQGVALLQQGLGPGQLESRLVEPLLQLEQAQGERVLQCAGAGQAAGAALRVCQGITGLLNCPLYATHHLLCQRPRPAY